jgi:hypothetical protein
MQYVVTCSFDINDPITSIIRQPITFSLDTYNVGHSFVPEIKEMFMKEVKEYFSENQIIDLVRNYSEPKLLLEKTLLFVHYKNATDVPEGKTIEIKGAGDVLAIDVANVISEEIKKIKIPTET